MDLASLHLRLGKFLCAEFELSNQTAKLIFQLLFVDRYSIVKAVHELMTLFELGASERETLDSHVRDLGGRFAGYEYIPQDGSPEGNSRHMPTQQAKEG